ncbi:MAG: ribose-phosphate diphosphokinase, partial [Acidobacteria bacterium]|nr:ribose-phosphate diphosphokinase [Acidobacteriota bacterium]
ILTIDLHAGQIQGFFDIPMDHLYAVKVFVDHIKQMKIKNITVASPDVGGIKMARAYAKRLETPLAIVDKRRISEEDTEVMNILGEEEIKGKNVLIIDDLVATAGSLVEAANALKKAGAKDVYAAIQIVEYSDFLCSDCLFLTQQLNRLKEEFAGKINIAFQFFPLEGKCNTVVAKDIHPGACELTAIAAYDPARFVEIHDEIFANFNLARNPGWREDLARRFGAEGAADNPYTMTLIQTIVETGREYEKTSDQYDHGIRSTPTMIINGRMIIGTLPYEHMQAICRALVEEHEGGRRFIENWVPGKARR